MKYACPALLAILLAACAHAPADPAKNTATLHLISAAGSLSESNEYALYGDASCAGKAEPLADFSWDTRKEAWHEITPGQPVYLRAMFQKPGGNPLKAVLGTAGPKKYCINVTRFTPVKGHVYDVSQNFVFDKCTAYIVDHDPAQSPPALERIGIKDSCLPPKTHREKDAEP